MTACGPRLGAGSRGKELRKSRDGAPAQDELQLEQHDTSCAGVVVRRAFSKHLRCAAGAGNQLTRGAREAASRFDCASRTLGVKRGARRPDHGRHCVVTGATSAGRPPMLRAPPVGLLHSWRCGCSSWGPSGVPGARDRGSAGRDIEFRSKTEMCKLNIANWRMCKCF